MPYNTDRGVTSYSDRNTPAEYATGQDEDADAFNTAQKDAYLAAATMADLLDDMYGAPIPGKTIELCRIADQLTALLARVRAISG